MTVTHPFRPPAEVTADDHRRLAHVLAQHPSFTLTGRRTAWFGDTVVFVELEAAAAVRALTEAVTAAFPQFPWAGPAPGSGRGTWRHLRSYPPG